MALNAYLTLTGRIQGEIRGPVTQFGRVDSIEIFGWSHEVVAPRDVASGMATGKHQHKAILVTKAIDMTTPLLMRALISSEPITSWRLECWRFGLDGTQEPYYQIELVNAIITGIVTEQFNNQQPQYAERPVQEHVSFVYQNITWTWLDGGVSTEDSLSSRT